MESQPADVPVPMEEAETQPADVDMRGTPVPQAPTAVAAPTPNAPPQTPSASAASSGGAAPA
eukprot:8093470-Alexandrium_andersonii.AAC.1